MKPLESATTATEVRLALVCRWHLRGLAELAATAVLGGEPHQLKPLGDCGTPASGDSASPTGCGGGPCGRGGPWRNMVYKVKQCCTEDTAKCKACEADKTVEEFCKQSPRPSVCQVPALVLKEGVLETSSSARTKAKYTEISKSVSDLLSTLDQTCNYNKCPVGEFAGCVLRFAGHDFMDYKDGTGGADGCVDFNDGDNAGLLPCLSEGENGIHLGQVWDKYRREVSLADFLVIAAAAWDRNMVQFHVARTHHCSATLRSCQTLVLHNGRETRPE